MMEMMEYTIQHTHKKKEMVYEIVRKSRGNLNAHYKMTEDTLKRLNPG